MGLFLFWLILAICVGAWASSRGHSGFGMFLVAFLLSPLIGFIIEAVRTPDRGEIESRQVAGGAMKKCPACAELIRAEAIKCRYCGEAVNGTVEAASPDGEQYRQCTQCKRFSKESTHCVHCGEALGVAPPRNESQPVGFGG